MRIPFQGGAALSHVVRGIQESNARRRGRELALALAALSGLVVGLIAVGPLAVAIAVVGTAAALAMLCMLLRSLDRSRRRRRLGKGELATAGATMRAHEFVRVHPDNRLTLPGPALLLGELAVTQNGLGWRPSPRFTKRGAEPLAWTWEQIDHVEIQRLRSLIRCDAIAIVFRDGDDAILYATDPAFAERHMARMISVIERP